MGQIGVPKSILASVGTRFDVLDIRFMMKAAETNELLRNTMVASALSQYCFNDVFFYFTERAYARVPSKRKAIFIWDMFLNTTAPLLVNVQSSALIAIRSLMAQVINDAHIARNTMSIQKIGKLFGVNNSGRIPPHNLFEPIVQALFNEGAYKSQTGGAFDDFLGAFMFTDKLPGPPISDAGVKAAKFRKAAVAAGFDLQALGM